MLLDDLLIASLSEECLRELRDHLPDISETIIQTKIQDYLKRKPPIPSFKRDLAKRVPKPCVVSDDLRCCARIWNDHQGDRCHSRKSSGDFCGKHHRMLANKEYLVFGRYDADKPTINEKGNLIPWHEGPPYEELNIVFQYQRKLLERLNR